MYSGYERHRRGHHKGIGVRMAVLGAGVPLIVLTTATTEVPRRAWLLALAALVTALASGIKWFGLAVGRVPAQLALGIAAISVGIGIGIRFATTSGPLIPTALGCLALVGGIVVLGALTNEFLGSVPDWWRLSLLPISLVVLLAIYATFPAVMAAAPAPTPLTRTSPADLGYADRSVDIRTRDGVQLSAQWVPSSNGAAIIVLHGSGSNRTSTRGQATVLARHGFGVLMLDARGHGASGGQAMDFGWYGERDVSAAVDWLRQRADVRPDRIAVLGLSMGGEEAIGAAGADGRIRAVVAEGATGRTAADKAGWLPHGVLGSIQRGLDRVTFGLAGVLSGAPEPVTLTSSARRASPRPILLIVAGNVPDESRAAATIQAGSPSNVRIWVAANAGHVVGLATDPGGWERTVVTFLTASLELS